MKTNLKQISHKKIVWYQATEPTTEDLDYLREKFGFHPLDIEDVKTTSQRPKLEDYDDYIFLVLLFAYYDRQVREIIPVEVDFFIGKNYLVSTCDTRLDQVELFFRECLEDEAVREHYMAGHPVALLQEIMHRLQSQTYLMLDHISIDIENIERQIFTGRERRMVKEILAIRRNIVSFRRIMQTHKNVIKHLMATHTKFFMPDEMNTFFAATLDRSKDIWDYLETHKENIEAFAQTNEALISFKLNDIMKILTVISVILIPANLVASIFGMNITHVPLATNPQGFWVVLGIIGAVILSFLTWFKSKRWL